MSSTASAFAAVLLALLLQQNLQGVAWAKAVPKEFFTEEGSGAPEEKACHLASLIIDSRNLPTADHILAPQSVDIGECVGSCSALHHYTNYDLLRRLIGKEVQEPCCVPAKLRPIPLLIRTDSGVQINSFEDLRVAECGCH